jgi:two-component system, chemotaxis family, chemotaxis protein CheY
MRINKILIVDDSPISRRMLKSSIPKDPEYQFFEAGDGQQGLEMFREVRPQVTFMDLTMPVMDGISSVQEIMKLDETASVVVLTADVQARMIMNAYQAGAFLVLKKPPTKESIQDALNKVAERER